MIDWKSITGTADIAEIKVLSKEQPCIIFKHSTRCNLSAMALFRLEEDWKFSKEEIQPYMLDVIQHQQLSQVVAEEFSAYHESPQVLLIQDGECTFETSHLDISVEEIEDGLEEDSRFW